MKILITLLSFLLQATIAMADIYTDGLKKLSDAGAISVIEGLQGQLDPTQQGKVKDAFEKSVEVMADYYRKNMTESEFRQYVDFQLQPEMVQATRNVMGNVAAAQKTIMNHMAPALMAISQGQTPSNIPHSQCNPTKLRKILRYLDINGTDKTLATSMSSTKAIIANEMAKGSAADKEKKMDYINRLFDYLNRNVKTVVVNTMIETASESDIDTFLSIEKQPFFPSYEKTLDAMIEDMPQLLQKLLEKMRQ